jgi:hypothetical protein
VFVKLGVSFPAGEMELRAVLRLAVQHKKEVRTPNSLRRFDPLSDI